MNQHTRDVIVGSFVAVGLGVLVYLSVSIGGARISGGESFQVYATFDEVGGLTTHSPVVIGGVKVGSVASIRLDDRFQAVVALSLDQGLELPADTSAAILTAGVLGNQYVGLLPGAEEETLKPGDYLTMTEDAVVLERLIGKVVQNLGVQ